MPKIYFKSIKLSIKISSLAENRIFVFDFNFAKLLLNYLNNNDVHGHKSNIPVQTKRD